MDARQHPVALSVGQSGVAMAWSLARLSSTVSNTVWTKCGDGTEWLARAGTPYAVPELYSVVGTTGNATAMAQAQLGGYDSWIVSS